MSTPSSRSPAVGNDALNATLRLLTLLPRSADTLQWRDPSGGRALPRHTAVASAERRVPDRFRLISTTGAVDWRGVCSQTSSAHSYTASA